VVRPGPVRAVAEPFPARSGSRLLREQFQDVGPTRRSVDASANAIGTYTMPLEAAVFKLDPGLGRTFGDKSHFNLARVRWVWVGTATVRRAARRGQRAQAARRPSRVQCRTLCHRPRGRTSDRRPLARPAYHGIDVLSHSSSPVVSFVPWSSTAAAKAASAASHIWSRYSRMAATPAGSTR
jgi:hypothetical protein